MKPGARKKVLAVASAGGHFVQLRRLRPAWAACEVTYLTTDAGYRAQVLADAVAEGELTPRFETAPDASLWSKSRLVLQLLAIVWAMARIRPDVVVSTGAAPGYFALRFGKLIGCKTIWIDSIANAEELSLSGRKVARFADLYLTQWPHLAAAEGAEGPRYEGAVL